MKRYPSISIAIPTYNEEENIQRCLSSIFNQRYQGTLEVFIVDGGSTDRTIAIAKRYPVKVRTNRYKQAEYGKKIGLDHATGKYFMILDCDMSLLGKKWIEKMVSPLENNFFLAGSWTKFVSMNDNALNRYITLDPLQRDPLFEFLTPSVAETVREKNKNYWIVRYEIDKILPSGFCLFRKKDLEELKITKRKKFMELDNLVIYVKNDRKDFAYVQTIGIYHPFLKSLRILVRKRWRNIITMYFDQPDPREWTWVDWSKKRDILKLTLWTLYTNTIVLPVVAGIYKSLKHKTWAGLYEPLVNLIDTDVTLLVFLNNAQGRRIISSIIK